MSLLLGVVLGNSSRNTVFKLSFLAEILRCLLHRGYLFRPRLLPTCCFAKNGEVVLSTTLTLARRSENILFGYASVDILVARIVTLRRVLPDSSTRLRLCFVSQ